MRKSNVTRQLSLIIVVAVVMTMAAQSEAATTTAPTSERMANGFVDTGVRAEGLQGENGQNGPDGKSAYDIAVNSGFSGTLQEWLDSLKGKNGTPVEFQMSNTMLQWRYNEGDSAWNNLFNIPQPSLVFSPHVWSVGTEYNFGDGSYGRRYKGNITAAAGVVVNINLNLPSTYRVIDQGGYFQSSNVANSVIAFPYSFPATPDSCGLWAHDTENWHFYSRLSTDRTVLPYDIWVRYIKA